MKHDHPEQRHLIENYIKEATDYQEQNSFISISRKPEDADALFTEIHNKILNVLKETTNGSLAFDVSFCRLLALIDCTNTFIVMINVYIAFLLYYIFASCFPSTRYAIKEYFACIIDERHPSNDTMMKMKMRPIIEYFENKYLPSLNENKCVEFKYNDKRSSKVRLSILKEHIMSCVDLQHGDICIASLICEFAQYPCTEFIYFVNDFMTYLPTKYGFQQLGSSNVLLFDDQMYDYTHCLQFNIRFRTLLCCDYECRHYTNYISHHDKRVASEIHILSLAKLDNNASAGAIGSYFHSKCNYNINCYVDPRTFIDIVEFAFLNPWQRIKEAMMAKGHHLSIFLNTFDERGNLTQHDDNWYKQCIKNVDVIFNEIIDRYFDKTDEEWMNAVVGQILGFTNYLFDLKDCKYKKELIQMITDYVTNDSLMRPIWCYRYLKLVKYRNLLSPAAKKRRLNV